MVAFPGIENQRIGTYPGGFAAESIYSRSELDRLQGVVFLETVNRTFSVWWQRLIGYSFSGWEHSERKSFIRHKNIGRNVLYQPKSA